MVRRKAAYSVAARWSRIAVRRGRRRRVCVSGGIGGSFQLWRMLIVWVWPVAGSVWVKCFQSAASIRSTLRR
nr:MAG TPA: hypothetical protein [Caudoviricetes sp.]